MNKKALFLSLIQASALISALPLTMSTSAADTAMKDGNVSFGLSYTESTETINNPGAGYTSTIWAVCKPGSTPVYSPSTNLALFFIDIGNFSSGINGTTDDDGNYTAGTDYDLDDAFFESWDTTLQNCRDNGCMVALRFRYDANGKDNPEPATFEQVLNHIQQIKDSGLLEKYSDIIAYVESGFVGKWGEQHGGKYTSLQYKAQLLEALLQAVPAPIPVTVRTPDIFAEWAGIKRADLADSELIDSLTESTYTSDVQANRYRVGLYNDGYMGSNSDLGTYANREIETDWLHNQTYTSYYGGEFSGNISFAQQYETYLPENAIPEMYKTHLSYINSNIFQLYKDYTFSAEYDTVSADNSAYYGQNVYKFMRDHLGYRFVVRKSEISAQTEQGGEAVVNFEVENTGFANVIPSVQSYVILEKDGVYTLAETDDIDCHNWDSCTVSSETLNINIPDNIEPGDWNVYLKLNMGTEADIKNMTNRSIRFANENIWNGSLGANYMGSITVEESAEKGTDNADLYSVSKDILIDGVISSPYEWADVIPAEKDGSDLKIYTFADDQYLYVMSNVPKDNASAPVYNLQFNNELDGERYWIYFASNGFVYFNHGDYSSAQCKWSDDMVEFRVPLAVVGFEKEIAIKNLRVFMQDSGDGWKLMSDITIPDCSVNADFGVISVPADVLLNEGESYEYTVIPNLPDGSATYEWSFNGEVISGADSAVLALSNITKADEGEYTVKITSESGIEKFVTAFSLSVASKSNVLGDADGNGVCNVADAVMLQKWLLGAGELTCWENVDLCKDNRIDVADFAVLRGMIV
ncbi:MAG: DUF4832 domain-containing protein [Ruminococcus flavefaciens]|nr:DUF4832 domain-containing protein [Ruminococcus flavefaciens]MCM1229836.1 DUF4832 domain-containing protein [Ruminococcus flavefaciens]